MGKRDLHLILIAILLTFGTGCDDYSHDAIVNTPPPNYVTLLASTNLGGNADDYANDLLGLPEGGYALAGTTSSWGNGDRSIFFVILNSERQAALTKFYGGWGEDYGEAVIRTSEDGFLIVGGTSSYDMTTNTKVDPIVDPDFEFLDQNMYLVKTNEAGQVWWERAIGDVDYFEWATSAVVSGDGFLVAGVRVRSESEEDLVLVGVTGDGDVAWRTTYLSSATHRYARILATSDGHFVLGGFGRYGGDRGRDPQLIKIDAAGGTLWDKRFGWSESDERIYSVVATDDGMVACGSSHRFANTDSAEVLLYLLKVDLEGTLVWEETYTETGMNEGRAMVQKNDGSFLVCGQNQSVSRIEACLINADGQLVWSDAVGVVGEARSMLAADQSYIVAGYTYQSALTGVTDAVLLEFEEDLTNVQ